MCHVIEGTEQEQGLTDEKRDGMGSQKGFWSLVNLSEGILGNSLKFIKPKPLCKNTYLCYKRVFSISTWIEGYYIKSSTFYS